MTTTLSEAKMLLYKVKTKNQEFYVVAAHPTQAEEKIALMYEKSGAGLPHERVVREIIRVSSTETNLVL